MQLQLIGFHATDIRACSDIKAREKFIISDNNLEIDFNANKINYHWLGKGVYFWSNNFEMAQVWAEHRKPQEAIIKVNILCDEEDFLDFTVESNFKSLEEVVEQLIDEKDIKLAEDLFDKKNKLYPLIGYAIDYLFKEKESRYKVVYFLFWVNSRIHKIIPKITPQICVKDQSVINFKTMELYKSDKSFLQLDDTTRNGLKLKKPMHNKMSGGHRVLNIEKIKRGVENV